MGVVIISEKITLNPLGTSFRGDATFDVYDFAGNVLVHQGSVITGERMTAVDDPTAIPNKIPGLPQSITQR